MPSDVDTKRPARLPVTVDGGQIIVGRASASFKPHDSASLLRSYLTLIRSIRCQKRAPDVVLRRDDIEVLAQYLEIAEESVLDRLASLMGATRTQRTAMLSVFASGALLIGLSSSTAAASSPSPGSDVPGSPVVVVVATDIPIEAPDAAVVIVASPAAPPTARPEAAPAVPSNFVAVATPPTAGVVASPDPSIVAVSPSASGAAPTTSAQPPAGDPPAVATPTVVSEPSVDVAEPPVAAAEPLVDAGTPPVPTSATTPPTTTANPTSPGGVGEPPFDDPTSPDPGTVAVGAPPVPPTTQSTDAEAVP